MRELRLDNGHIEILKLVAERNCCEVESLPDVYRDEKRTRKIDAVGVAERVSELLYPEVALLQPSRTCEGYVILSLLGKQTLQELEKIKNSTGKYQNMYFPLDKAKHLPWGEVPVLLF
jgi:hypothetical protein